MISSLPNKRRRIGKRLKTVAESAAVRLSSETFEETLCAVDVGTDHAKLAIALIADYGFESVAATDINEGPCAAALKNIRSAGDNICDKIKVIKTDGLNGLENIKCNRIIIAGMGGELIVKILSEAEFTREKQGRIKFVLQPQSKEYALRRYLYENGYFIIDEKWIEDAGKEYCVISAVYDGIIRSGTLFEMYFGRFGAERAEQAFVKFFYKKYRALRESAEQRKNRVHGESKDIYKDEELLLKQMKEYMAERNWMI